MADTQLDDALLELESLMAQGQAELALDQLISHAKDAEDYVALNCEVSDKEQWFAFPTLFERLSYRRVEGDQRQLHDIAEPFDRLYADLALCQLHLGDYDSAMEALKTAIRWNPMACDLRLNLAGLYREKGDIQEYLALTYSVFSRAADALYLARAYSSFAEYFMVQEKARTAAACLFVAQSLDPTDSQTQAMLQLVAGAEADPKDMTEAEAEELLEAEGLPFGANVDVAICLIMCADTYRELGQTDEATKLMLRLRDLVGEARAKALIAFVHEEA